MKSRAIRNSARGEDCTLQMVGVCNGNPEIGAWIDVSTPTYPDAKTLVSRQDCEWVSSSKWNAWLSPSSKQLRVQRRVGWKPSRLLQLHREIMLAADGLVVDHIDGDPLNNMRSNLRVCTNKQNSRNSISRSGKSNYKGVSKHCGTKKWRAYITIDRKQKHLGFYESEIDAAKAYDAAAIKYFGEYARPNFGGAT